MNKKLSNLSMEELVSLERIISTVCKKYENIAQMNMYQNEVSENNEYKKATNVLTYYNDKRDSVLVEMEKRINEIFGNEKTMV